MINAVTDCHMSHAPGFRDIWISQVFALYHTRSSELLSYSRSHKGWHFPEINTRVTNVTLD